MTCREQSQMEQIDCVTDIADLRGRVRAWKSAGCRVALVPTMGNLHDGHLALVDAARARADRVIVSIFVNPTQFAPTEDFANYPRTEQRDIALLATRQADLVFMPDVETMYPEGAGLGTRVEVPALEGILCARSRPHHFGGVATVVNRLFNMIRPDVALFGKKDYQQLLVIARMVRDLSMEVDVCGVDTVRDQHGLALSSRNSYLSAEQRLQAAGLQRVLRDMARRIMAGDTGYAALESAAERALADIGMQPEYVSVRAREDLHEPTADDRDLVVMAAARLGPARLIDNIEVTRDDQSCG